MAEYVSLHTAATKLILPSLPEKLFQFRKSVVAQKLPDAFVSDFQEWIKILQTMEGYMETQVDGAENRRIIRKECYQSMVIAAKERSNQWELLMQEELAKSEVSSSTATDVAERLLVLEYQAKEHRSKAERYALLKIVAAKEASEEFVDKDVQMLFDCNREDLAYRSMLLFLQYSLLIYKQQKVESREFLIRAVAYFPEHIVKNCHNSRQYSGHLYRELLVDFICLQAWKDVPGRHYLPWKLWKGACGNSASTSSNADSKTCCPSFRINSTK